MVIHGSWSQAPAFSREQISHQPSARYAACVLFMISPQLSTKHQPKKSQGKMLPTTLSTIVVSIIGFRRKSQLLGSFRMSKVWAWENNTQPPKMSPQQPKSSFLKRPVAQLTSIILPHWIFTDDFEMDDFGRWLRPIGFFLWNWVPPQQKSKEWLSELHLSHYTTQLLQWCQANGCVPLDLRAYHGDP